MMIRIKKSKRGSFTRLAKRHHMSVAVYARKVLKRGSHASTATKRKANFARNARKWRHKK